MKLGRRLYVHGIQIESERSSIIAAVVHGAIDAIVVDPIQRDAIERDAFGFPLQAARVVTQ
jgi:hypothetical protein